MSETTDAPMAKLAALRWLVHHSPVTVASYTELAEIFRWERAKTWKVVHEWRRKGYVETNTAPNDGSLTVTIIPNVLPLGVSDDAGDDENDTVREGAAPLPVATDGHLHPPVAGGSSGGVAGRGTSEPATDTVYATYVPGPHRGGGGFDAVEAFHNASLAERLLILVAAGLSGTAAYMSVTGMVVMYPAEPAVIMVFGALIEVAKFIGFGVLAASWRGYGFFPRWIAAALLLVAAVINASGVYGRLISNHAGPAAGRTAAYTERDGDAGANLEVAQARLADIDRRIALIDAAAEGAAKRGKSKSAISAIEAEKRQRAALVAERQQVAAEVAKLKAGRSTIAARHQVDEAAAMPVRYAAALFEDFGLIQPGTDPEKLIRWLSFLLLVAGDPLALSLMVAINSRSRRRAA